MDVTERLRTAASAQDLHLRPGLTAEDIARVRAEVPVPLPAELVRLMSVTAGAEDLLDLDLTGARHSVDTAELMPAGHPVAADGYGNFWVLDLTPDTGDTAPVFFLSHDPPVLVYQAPDLSSFLVRALDGTVPGDAPHVVWGSRPGALTHEAATSTGDQALRQFARRLGDAWTFVDLRHRSLGDGVAWGRYGPRTRLARHGWERIFAYAPYEKPRKPWRRFGFASPRRAG